MSWLFSQALVDQYSPTICSDGERSVLLKSTHSVRAYLSSDKMTEFLDLSQYGMTLERLTESRGDQLLTSLLEDSRARILARPAGVQELTANEVAFGNKWHVSLAKYDLNLHLWRTHQISLHADLEKYWEIFPKWGITLRMEFFQLAPLVRHTHVRACSFWPTLTASDGVKRFGPHKKQTTRKNNGSWIITRKSGVYGAKLTDALGGKPSQTFAEWLMGFPIGWTQFTHLEMPKFQQWQLLHGQFFQGE